jgi:hypothetical protein
MSAHDEHPQITAEEIVRSLRHLIEIERQSAAESDAFMHRLIERFAKAQIKYDKKRSEIAMRRMSQKN